MPEYEKIGVDEVKQHLNDGDALVVNVLSKDEYDRQHIPKSHSVPVGAEDFEDRIRRLAPDRERAVIVHCQDPDCEASPKAARKLVEIGYQKVFDFEAGIDGWKEAGFKVEGQKQTVRADVE